jgi:hypothetical protein
MSFFLYLYMRGGNIGRMSASISYTVVLWTIPSSASGHNLSGHSEYCIAFGMSDYYADGRQVESRG